MYIYIACGKPSIPFQFPFSWSLSTTKVPFKLAISNTPHLDLHCFQLFYSCAHIDASLLSGPLTFIAVTKFISIVAFIIISPHFLVLDSVHSHFNKYV